MKQGNGSVMQPRLVSEFLIRVDLAREKGLWPPVEENHNCHRPLQIESSLFAVHSRQQPNQGGTPSPVSPKQVPVPFSRKSIQGLIIISLFITLRFIKIALYFAEPYHVYYRIIL